MQVSDWKKATDWRASESREIWEKNITKCMKRSLPAIYGTYYRPKTSAIGDLWSKRTPECTRECIS